MCIHLCEKIQMHIHIYIYMCVCVSIYIYIYSHIHISVCVCVCCHMYRNIIMVYYGPCIFEESLNGWPWIVVSQNYWWIVCLVLRSSRSQRGMSQSELSPRWLPQCIYNGFVKLIWFDAFRSNVLRRSVHKVAGNKNILHQSFINPSSILHQSFINPSSLILHLAFQKR